PRHRARARRPHPGDEYAGRGNHVRGVVRRGHRARPMTPHVLVVDNDREMVQLLERHLAGDGIRVTATSGGKDAIAALAREQFDVIVTDLVMDEFDGLDLLGEAQRLQPSARVILMTAFASLETAIAAMRKGAYDYLSKPFKMAEVTVAVRRALEDRQLRD